MTRCLHDLVSTRGGPDERLDGIDVGCAEVGVSCDGACFGACLDFLVFRPAFVVGDAGCECPNVGSVMIFEAGSDSDAETALASAVTIFVAAPSADAT